MRKCQIAMSHLVFSISSYCVIFHLFTLDKENFSYANYFLSFAGSMLQLSALSYKQASIENTCKISCRDESTSINLNKTKFLSNLYTKLLQVIMPIVLN